MPDTCSTNEPCVDFVHLNGADTRNMEHEAPHERSHLDFIQVQEFHHSRGDPAKAIQMGLNNTQLTRS